jgi:putative peptidoglycan lipid II flippase
LAALLTGVLNSLNKFAVGAAAPILLNISMITALFFFADNIGPSLSWSVFIAGIMQFLWIYIEAKRSGYKIRLLKPEINAEVKKVLKLMIPGTIGAGVMQINILIDMILASFLPTGALSYLYYADRLNQLPLSIFGVAIGTVLLPSMSKMIRKEEYSKAKNQQEKAIDLALKLSLPSAVGLIVLSHPIIELIFGHGKFTIDDVNATAPTLAAFAIGLPAYVMSKVFTTTFFARQDTKTPVKIALMAVIANFIMNITFIGYLQHVGMALATALSAWIQMFLLIFFLKRQDLLCFKRSFWVQTSATVLSTFLMFISIKIFQSWIQISLDNTIIVDLLKVISSVFVGLISYGGGILFFNKIKKIF